MTPALYGKNHSAVAQVYRIATKNVFDPAAVNSMFSDADLISEYGLVSPMSIIRYSRLSLFARIAGKSPLCLVDLLKTVWGDCFGWVQALRSDFKWLYYSGLLISPAEDISSHFDAIAVDYRSFVRSVRRYSLTKFANFDVPSIVPEVSPPPPLFLIHTALIAAEHSHPIAILVTSL